MEPPSSIILLSENQADRLSDEPLPDSRYYSDSQRTENNRNCTDRRQYQITDNNQYRIYLSHPKVFLGCENVFCISLATL